MPKDNGGTGETYQPEKILGKALASGGDSSIIELPKSIGAKARSQKVKMPNGQYGKIKENSKITKVVVYAEKGAKKPIKVAKFLSEQYGVAESEWKKVRGEGLVV